MHKITDFGWAQSVQGEFTELMVINTSYKVTQATIAWSNLDNCLTTSIKYVCF